MAVQRTSWPLSPWLRVWKRCDRIFFFFFFSCSVQGTTHAWGSQVTVATGEEEEDTVFKMRARLFRYAREVEPPLWKERGIGDVRLLRDRGSNKLRLLMRRDKTLK